MDNLESLHSRMDPIDVAVLRAFEEGGLHAAARAMRCQTALGTRYRIKKAREVLEHYLREPSPMEECVDEIVASVPAPGWTASRRALLREFLAGASSMHHLCRRDGRDTNEGVYVRGRLLNAGQKLSPRAREWLAWRQAMPLRYPGMDGVRVTSASTLGSAKAMARLGDTHGMCLSEAGRHLGVSNNTVKKWRGRAAGLSGL